MKNASLSNSIKRLVRTACGSEGYVLVYALIVTAILTAVVLGVFSVSLSNLNAQQQSVEDMQARYGAEGCMEIVVAELDDYIRGSVETYTPTDPAEMPETSRLAAKGQLHATIVDCIESFLAEVNTSVSEYEIASVKDDGGDTTIEITMETASDLPDGVDAVVTIPVSVTGDGVAIRSTLEYQLVFYVEQGDETGTPSLLGSPQYEYEAHAEVKGVPAYLEYQVVQGAAQGNE